MKQKYILPLSVIRYSPLTSMRCTKEISRPGMANYRKSRPLLKTAAPPLFANKSMPLRPKAVVSDTLFSELYVIQVLSFYFSQLIRELN